MDLDVGVEDLTQEMGEGSPPDSNVPACSRLISSSSFFLILIGCLVELFGCG